MTLSSRVKPRQSEHPKITNFTSGLYFVLGLLFYCSLGLFNSIWVSLQNRWHAFLFLLTFSCFLLGRLISKDRRYPKILPALWIYAFGIILVGLFHHLALNHNNLQNNMVNVIGTTADQWSSQNIRFLILYLFFPLLILLHIQWLSPIRPSMMMAAVLLTGPALSMMIAYTQFFFDFGWLAKWSTKIGKIDGLSTDPNAYALIAYLSGLGCFVIQNLANKKFYRLIIAILGFLFFLSIILAKNRTLTSATALFFLFLPLAVAIGRYTMAKNNRLLLGALPIISFAAGLFIINTGYQVVSQRLSAATGSHSQNVMLRLVNTWEKFDAAGLSGVVLNSEIRGLHFPQAIALIEKAPYAGWGPGGFYREASNQFFRSTGRTVAFNDSALSHYLMIGGDFGWPLFLLNLVLAGYPLWCSTIIFRNNLKNQLIRTAIAIFVLGYIVFLLALITMPPSYFPGTIFSWTLIISVACLLARNYAPKHRTFKNVGIVLAACGFFGLVAWGSYQVTYGSEGYQNRLQQPWWPYRFDRNCYGIEHWKEGRVRWCGQDAQLGLQVTEPLKDWIRLKIAAFDPDLKKNPKTVWIGNSSGPLQKITLMNNKWRTVRIKTHNGQIIKDPNSLKQWLLISIEVSHTWSPSDHGSPDDRTLGVAVRIPNN